MGKQNRQMQMFILDIHSGISQDHLLRQIKNWIVSFFSKYIFSCLVRRQLAGYVFGQQVILELV